MYSFVDLNYGMKFRLGLGSFQNQDQAHFEPLDQVKPFCDVLDASVMDYGFAPHRKDFVPSVSFAHGIVTFIPQSIDEGLVLSSGSGS